MTDGAPIRTVFVGLGPIGLRAARFASQGSRLLPVAAVDLDPALAGRELAELADAGRPGVEVEAELGRAVERGRPQLAVVCTSSSLEAVSADLLLLADAGVNVVTPCEEMLLPELSHPELARRLHRAALAGGATLLGIGVNPGFVLDFLPVVLSAVCSRVRRVRARRVLDVTRRRRPLQRKVGAGLDPGRFEELVAAGRLGHVGMRESVALVGRALGMDLDSVSQTVEPVIAERAVEAAGLTIPRGAVAGIRNVGLGLVEGERRIELVLEMYAGARESFDRIEIEGEPSLRCVVEGGIPGDDATASLLVNSGPRVVAASPGLATVLEIPPASGSF